MKQASTDFKNFIPHLRLEAISLALLMAALTYKSDYSMWWLLVGFPLVDLCLLGYAFGPKIGAITYNFAHNATIPTLLIAAGIIGDNSLLSVVGYVWTFHSAFDRILGFGLKHTSSFHDTHMGRLKKKNA